MNKYLLIKYFKQEASEAEIDEIIRWVEVSDENKRYFARIKQLWDLSGEWSDTGEIHRPDKKRKKLYRIFYFSAAAAVAVLLMLDLFWNPRESGNISTPIQTAVRNTITVYTNKGVKGQIILPDSTLVWMNSDSRISYPAVFDPTERNVSMSGEIYFEVKKDPQRPMYITTNKNLKVEVLGTSFSIRSYNNDSESKTTLFTGSILLHYQDKKTDKQKALKIEPDESVTCKELTLPVVTKPDNIEKEIAWKDGELLFENTPMEEVLKMLERWYGARFIIKNEKVYNYKLTSTFQSESLSEVVDLMKYCMPIHFNVKNNVVTIY